MRSCRIINSRSSSVQTTEVEVLYEKQRGLKHTHTVGCHGTGAISHTHTQPPTPLQHLFLSCPNTSQSLLFLWPLHPSIPFSRSLTLFPFSLYHLSAHREPGLSRQTRLSPTALPRLNLKSFSFAPITPPSSPPSSSSSPDTSAEGLLGGTGGLQHSRSVGVRCPLTAAVVWTQISYFPH